MGITDIGSFVKEWRIDSDFGLNDHADSYSSFWTILISVICTTAVSVMVHGMSPIVCHATITSSGSDLENYINSYCLVEGAVTMTQREVAGNFPAKQDEWKKMEERRKTSYYPLVPLFLSALVLIPFLISTLWKIFYQHKVGTDFQDLMECANSARLQNGEQRERIIAKIANCIVDSLQKNKEYRTGCCTRIREKLHYGFCSKRFGSRLSFSYILVKLSYLAEHLCTLIAMHSFLGLSDEYHLFGWQMMVNLFADKRWHDSRIFPRVAYCNIPIKHNSVTYLVAQCALPVNLLNEAVFIFLWFWHVFGFISMALSLSVWLINSFSCRKKENFIQKSLTLVEGRRKDPTYQSTEDLRVFTDNFLQDDGVFILQMMHVNVGGCVTNDLVASLWNHFRHIYDWKDLPKPTNGPPRAFV